MSTYLHPALKQFTDQQVRYAPHELKRQQLDRAETLLAEISPDREYPYQYVCFRITEYRPETYPDLVLSGRDLRHDLRLFIEDLAASAPPIPVAEAGQPVFTVEELSRRYNISTKTVNRWRERGLVSRRFMVDGRRRVGFLQSSIDRFVGNHAAEVDRGSRFSQLNEGERDDIVRRARRLAGVPTASLADVSRRIARKLNRSPETIRYTIKNYDRLFPEQAIFPSVRAPLDEPSKQMIYKAFRRGIGIDALAAKHHRTRSSIYRVLNELRAKRLLAKPVEYMHHLSFDRSNAERAILGPEPEAPRKAQTVRAPAGLPPYLQSLYEVPLLTREQEQHLFRKMNFLLGRAAKLRGQIDVNRVKATELDRIEKLLEDAEDIKRRLIRANLRLVVSIAKRHVSANVNLFELISDGNISLMRAVEKFDFGRGFKFSTYASWAIMKNFARTIPQENTRRDRFVTGHDLAFEMTPDGRSNETEIEQTHQRMQTAVEKILNRLEEREREIIIDRYGLSDRRDPATLEQVGHKFGVTKERIRQIEARAIRKLKEYATEEKLDLSLLN